jgi:hypothetical protein
LRDKHGGAHDIVVEPICLAASSNSRRFSLIQTVIRLHYQETTRSLLSMAGKQVPANVDMGLRIRKESTSLKVLKHAPHLQQIHSDTPVEFCLLNSHHRVAVRCSVESNLEIYSSVPINLSWGVPILGNDQQHLSTDQAVADVVIRQSEDEMFSQCFWLLKPQPRLDRNRLRDLRAARHPALSSPEQQDGQQVRRAHQLEFA